MSDPIFRLDSTAQVNVRILPAVPFVLGNDANNNDNTITEFFAQAALSGHRAIALNAGQAVYADSSNPNHAFLTLGITQSAATPGSNVLIYNNQAVTESSWAWVPGEPIFLGLNGLLTQIAPQAPPHLFVLQIGKALTTQKMWVSVQQPIFI